MYQNIPTKVLTGEVRLSYANLATPRASQQGGEPKYSVSLLIPKTDIATYQDIMSSIEAAAQEATSKLWGGFRPPNLEALLHDGDGVKEKTGVPYGEECRGHWVLNASSKTKPQVVHMSNINSELAPQDVYSGMRARVTINFYGYAHPQGGRGVGCGLGNVMKTRDDEPLAGGASAEADFAGVGAAAPAYPGAAAYPAQPQYAPPAPAYPAQPQYTPPAPAYPAQPQYGGAPVGAAPVNPLTGLPF